MKISECMTRDVKLVGPDSSLQEAARIMADIDAGSLPVAENDRLVGMITDRDIVVRAVCDGKGPDTQVRDVMSTDLKYCYEDDRLDEVASNMGDLQIRRLPVVNRDKQLVGIVALGDVAVTADEETSGEAVADISRGV